MNIIKKIVKGAKRAVLYGAFALKRTEEQQTTQLGVVEGGVERKNESKSILNELMNGQQTKQTLAYKEHFYKVLDKADKVSRKMKLTECKFDKNGEFIAGSGNIDFVSEEEINEQMDKTREERIDKTDSYKLEYITIFKQKVTNELEVASLNKEPIYDNSIKFFDNDDEVYLVEGLLETAQVKIVDETKRLVCLIFKYGELYDNFFENVINKPHTLLYYNEIQINSGKYQPLWNDYKVLKCFGVEKLEKGKIIYKVLVEKV